MKVQVNLFVEAEVADMFDQICTARGGKRPTVFTQMITRAHKKMERQIAAVNGEQPTDNPQPAEDANVT